MELVARGKGRRVSTPSALEASRNCWESAADGEPVASGSGVGRTVELHVMSATPRSSLGVRPLNAGPSPASAASSRRVFPETPMDGPGDPAGVGSGHASRRASMSGQNLPLDLRTRPYWFVFERFTSDATEAFFAEFLRDRCLKRQRVLMPLAYCAYISALVIWIAMTATGRMEHRSGAPGGLDGSDFSHPGILAVRTLHALNVALASACLYLQFRRPHFYRRHMEALVASFFCCIMLVILVNTMDVAKGAVIYFPCMAVVEAACRVMAILPPRGYLVVIGVSHAALWIGYPASGVADSFLDFYGQAILTGVLLPFCLFGAREADGRRRRDFARHQTLRSQLEVVTVEREGLRVDNDALREQLVALQREMMGTGADLESPLGKALAALDALRSDPRVRALGQWAAAALDGAITALLGSGSLLVPDLGRQVQEGRLQLDRDTRRWLFSELATGQVNDQFANGGHSIRSYHWRRPAPASLGNGSIAPSSTIGSAEDLALAADLDEREVGPRSPRWRETDAAGWRALHRVDSWEGFDPFALEKATGRPLLVVALAALEALGVARRLGPPTNLDRFAAFVSHCESRYMDNPYHNRMHAADVVQSMVCLMTAGGVGAHLSEEEKLAALVACIVHDYEHPGVNNNFLTATGAPLALLYNDRSPLESHHVSAAWTALREPQHNFLQTLPKPVGREVRRAVIDMVLATDMAQHFEVLGNFRKRAAAGALGAAPSEGASTSAERPSPPAPAPAAGPAGPLQAEDKQLLLAVAIKVCDIGHAAKPLALHVDWSQRIAAEFYSQGDRERELGLPVSPFMDRAASNLAKSQIGFMDFIVFPLLSALAASFPGVRETMVAGARRNYAHWQREAEAAPPPAPPARRSSIVH